ncbi:MAG: hypothetical protein M0Z66_01360 [Thermaerobacter sp.]|nr:hypothetical protein [Thermaerobacter sp.]
MRLTAGERSGTGAQGRLGAPGGAWAGDARREPRRTSNAPFRQDHRLRTIRLSLHAGRGDRPHPPPEGGDADIVPIVSAIREANGKKPLKSIPEVEPLAPQTLVDAVVICPFTGTTMAKLANAITDSPVWTALWQIPVMVMT